MSHPFKTKSDSNKGARLSKMIGGDAAKAGVTAHEKHMHKGEKPTFKRAAGGAVDGAPSRPRMDKASRKPAVNVNVIVGAGGQKQAQPVPVPVPVPAGGPAGPGPMAGSPGGMPMPPPGAGPAAGLPPGLPMRKRGGGVMDAGSGSGAGRLEKAKMNAKEARTIKPENRKRGGKA